MFVCRCGANIGRVVDVPGVVEYSKGLKNVVHVEGSVDPRFLPDPGEDPTPEFVGVEGEDRADEIPRHGGGLTLGVPPAEVLGQQPVADLEIEPQGIEQNTIHIPK